MVLWSHSSLTECGQLDISLHWCWTRFVYCGLWLPGMLLHISAVPGSCHSVAISVFEPVAEMPDVFVAGSRWLFPCLSLLLRCQMSFSVAGSRRVAYQSTRTLCSLVDMFFNRRWGFIPVSHAVFPVVFFITGTSSSWVCGFINFFLTLLISCYSQYIFWFIGLYCN
jgi:hypothetical protein